MNNGKICVSICDKSVTGTIAKIGKAEKFADVIEVRFDCLSKHVFNMSMDSPFLNLYWGNILRATKKPIISTYRPVDQGGHQHLNEKERHMFWHAGMGAEYYDVEEDIVADDVLLLQFTYSFEHLIVSQHYFANGPSNLNQIFDRLASYKADIVKIAAATDDVTDAIPVWQLLDRAKTNRKKIIPIAMGEAGKWTRILGLAHGSYMTYASYDEGLETAEGQITAKDLIEVYRVKELDLNTKVYGVIGDPVSESLSPYMHNPAFVEHNINAVFIPLQVKNLDEFMLRMVRPETREVELNFGGFAVTMPHKQSIIEHLDAIDPTAEKIGAVNTVKIDDGKLTGYNTDAVGFIMPLIEKFGDLKNARVAIFGAGGAARACVSALKEEVAEVTVFARDVKKASAFADEFGVEISQISNCKSEISKSLSHNFDIIVNATPVGMKGPLENESLLTAEQLDGVKFVYDLVTRSGDTPLISEAKKANVPAIGGIEMLLYQGAKQFEIWTGQTAPMDAMREAVFKKLDKIQK